MMRLSTSKWSSCLIATIVSAGVCMGAAGANAQDDEVLCLRGFGFGFNIATYHGYSHKPAAFDAPGTSTVVDSQTFETIQCDDGTSGSRVRTVHNYVDGPGKSHFDALDESMCEETGTLLTCP